MDLRLKKYVEFYLKLNGEQVGPYRLEDIQGWLNAGYIKPEDTAWYDGCPDWVKVTDLPGIDLHSAGHLVRTDVLLPFEAYTGKEPYVFVCYAHRDSTLVFEEINQLHNDGFRIWYDEGIGVSSEWPEEIAKAVLGCSIFLVFISPDATASVNCRNEINLALDEGKPFISVHLKESKLPPGLRLRMGDLQAIYRFKLTKDQYERKLRKTIKSFFEKGNDAIELESDIHTENRRGDTPKRNLLKYAFILSLVLLTVLSVSILFDFFDSDEESSEKEIEVKVLSIEQFRTVSSLGLEMVWCPPGSFQMGSPLDDPGRKEKEVLHQATISQGFYIGKYEVTQDQWIKVMGENPSFFNGSNRPVERVSWNDAKSFCDKLTRVEKNMGILPEGWFYDLPTESEWEYACRAGTRSPFAWGSSIDNTKANYQSEINSTQEVGFYLSNPWSLFDMHGNVSEWVYDKKGEYSNTPVVDTTGSQDGYNRIIRGGSWCNEADQLRSADRASAMPGISATFIGFRLAFKKSKPDLISPDLKLIGDKKMYHEGGTPWVDPGVITQDYRDGNLSSEIKVSGKVDPESLGVYTLYYSVSDYSGNESNLTREVEVRDTIAPVISLIGEYNMTLEIESIWTEPGFVVVDEFEGDLSDQVEMKGSVNLSSLGKYNIIYSVSDSSGNKSQTERTVNVSLPIQFEKEVSNSKAIDERNAELESLPPTWSSYESEELLKAVQNWDNVPSSVFPLGGVFVDKKVTMEIFDTEGNIIATKVVPKDTPLVAKSLNGQLLIVSPAEKSSMFAKVDLNDTNFKQKVAELFEVRKKQREFYELLGR